MSVVYYSSVETHMTDNIAKAIMKEVKNAQKAQVTPEKTSLCLLGWTIL